MEFTNLLKSMTNCSKLISDAMNDLLPSNSSESNLIESMRYSALSDGKKIRPFLVMSCADIFGVNYQKTVAVSCAIEFIHVYSLIHDDLPAMDDDDFRRGKLANHKKFNEATAILAGDALLTYAFEILSSNIAHENPAVRCEIISTIAKAAGFKGMIGGQMIDIENSKQKISKDQIFKTHLLKTGELFMASVESGAILGGANDEERMSLRNYGRDFGLAFQIKDDILDNVNDSENEFSLNKDINIVDIIGIDKSKEHLKILREKTINHLKIFGDKAKILIDLFDFIIYRNL